MSNQPAIPFSCRFRGDGASTTLTIQLLTDPVVMLSPATTPGVFLLASVLAAHPSDVANLSVGGLSITNVSYSSLTATLTLTFSSAPSSGSYYDLYGNLIY